MPNQPQPGRDRSDRRTLPLIGTSLGLLVSTLVLLAAPTVAIVWSVQRLSKTTGGNKPEILLPTILIVGLIALLGVLAALVAAFWRFGLTDSRAPLALPEGSIQAVIALSLILIFAIVGVYLHGVAGSPATRLVPGLTREQMATFTPGSIVSTRGVGGGRFDVTIVTPNSDQSDLAKQLLTTISTLVVAVAGFYFGQKSVREASSALRGTPFTPGSQVPAPSGPGPSTGPQEPHSGPGPTTGP